MTHAPRVEPNIELLERIIASTFEEMTPHEVRIEAKQALRFLRSNGRDRSIRTARRFDRKASERFLAEYITDRQDLIGGLFDG